ncbi:hypothetical protein CHINAEXTREME_07820 [Halobiforma lacisalsi AJ5]|uniref:Glycosyl hydrolase n=1 Tax=Natronobacterium lacisalsi AJ5 TaxID=358396 RepID=M0LXV3_NATLA|nr:hypothetical protein [Halobiforma lacisalsi]APW97685.1 hypothetical protein CHINAEXTREME_07820 [Halobiforma lacisalsi AJ5]EMA36925.1 hypothetical protein C445_01746 [Halobiforma lacisalsi AJ5]
MATAYAALRDRLLVCRAVGDHDPVPSDWTTVTRLEGHTLECVAASADAPERVFVGTFSDGLHRSTDGGDTFERLETGADFVSDAVMSLAVSPHDPDVVYAGTEPSRVYRSADGGDSWTHLEGIVDLPSAEEWYFPPRPHTHHVRWLEVDPFDPDRLYAGIEAGAFVYTEDGGETWHERPEGSRRDNHSLATHPDREGRIYAAAGDGYAESDDGGERWRQPERGLEHTYCWSVVPDPGDPDRVLVSSASGASRAHTAESAESYVYRKADGGPWERLEDRGLPTGEGVVRAVFDTLGRPGVVYAVTNRGLFVTDDFGDGWDRVGIEWNEEFAAQTPRGIVTLRS